MCFDNLATKKNSYSQLVLQALQDIGFRYSNDPIIIYHRAKHMESTCSVIKNTLCDNDIIINE